MAVAGHVSEGTITSSPGRTPSAASTRCSPAVAESTATAYGAPTDRANAPSNSAACGPEASHPERSTATTAAISSSSMVGAHSGTPFPLSTPRPQAARTCPRDRYVSR